MLIHAPFYDRYIKLCLGQNPLEELQRSLDIAVAQLSRLPEAKAAFSYTPNKWTIQQLVGHCIDTERIFQYRALRFVREQQAECKGFDEDAFAAQNACVHRSMASLIAEFKVVRQSSILLFDSLSESELNKQGLADGKAMNVRACGLIMSGHVLHHLGVLNERYLNA
jgi:hypothetical protein